MVRDSAVPTGSGPVTLLAALALLLGVPCVLGAAVQADSGPDSARSSGPTDGLHDRSGYPFRPPASSALEPQTRLAPVHVDRAGLQRWEAMVQFGSELPLWLHGEAEGGDFELAGAAAGGIFSRFSLQAPTNEFVEASFRVGLQLRGRYRAVAGRLELYHVSSHLGDEYMERTGRRRVSTSREGVALLLQAAPHRSLTLHAGPGFVLRSSRGFRAPAFRAGFDWRPSPHRDRGAIPYLAAEAFSWSERDWDPMLHLEVGLVLDGGRYQVGALLGSGPARAEQFFRDDETVWGLVFSIL